MATTDQVSGMADRTISGAMIWLLTYFLHRLEVAGYLQTGDATNLSPVLIILGMAAWGYWINRPKAIVQSAASLPGTTVITTAELAAATPNQANIIPNNQTQVIQPHEAKP